MTTSKPHGIKLTLIRTIMFALFALGATAALADDPKYGGIRFDCDVTVDGRLVAANTAVYAETWPTQMCVKPIVPVGKTFFRFESDEVEGVAKCPTHFYLQMDGSFFVVPPAFSDTVRDFRHVYATRVLWVDAKAKDGDAFGDGTEGNPYHTLQHAVDQVPDIDPTIIFAKPGDYSEGGGSLYNASNRVVIVQSRTILLKAVEGPSKTSIVGEEDTTTYPEQQSYCPKMGPLAKRCVAIDKKGNGSCVQGFTLRDGHASTGYEADGVTPVSLWGDPRTQGGIVYSNGGYINQVVDCVVSNCTAGKASIGGTVLRTRISNCHNASSLHENGWMVSCGIANVTGAGLMGGYANHPNGGGQDTLAGGSPLMLCTITGVGSWSSGTYWNGAYDASRWIPNAGARYFGSIFVDGNQSDACGGNGIYYTKTKTQFFCDLNNGDVRLMKGSLAENVPQPTVGTANWHVWATNFAAVATSDVNGNRLVFLPSGGPLPGAYQEPAQALVLSSTACGFDVTSPSGGMCGVPGETITIAPNSKGTRYAAGVSVGGVDYLFADLPGGKWSYTVPADMDVGTVTVTVIVSPYWYVDAVNGKDTNKGFLPDSAFRTLAYAMSKLSSGETLRALPGVYAEGVTDRDMNYTTPRSDIPRCRVAIRQGTVLESTDGPEKTIIMGAPSTDPSADEYGRGPGAVGCVRMTSASEKNQEVVRGFTLTGGRTALTGEAEMKGGAACYALWAGHEDYARLENCIISNNYSYSTTLAGLSAVGCVIATNFVVSGSSSGSTSRYYGTLVKDGRASDLHELKNSTIGKEATFNMRSDVTYRNCANCLIMGTVAWHSNDMTFTNCVFLTGKAAYKRVDCIITNEAAIAVDENYVPTNRSSAVVDYAGEKYGTPSYVFASKDARGGQRVYNGALDVGAAEYDWRGDYAKDIAKREVVVTAADPQVVEREGKVTLDPGASLTAEWTPEGTCARCDVKTSVTGTGTLTVSVDGAAIGTVTAADSPKTFNFGGAIGETSKIVFSYSQEEDDEGCAVIEKIGSQKGLLLLVR